MDIFKRIKRFILKRLVLQGYWTREGLGVYVCSWCKEYTHAPYRFCPNCRSENTEVRRRKQ